jgi:hypothetical protein
VGRVLVGTRDRLGIDHRIARLAGLATQYVHAFTWES